MKTLENIIKEIYSDKINTKEIQRNNIIFPCKFI